MKVVVFDNFNLVAFDARGEQMPDVQRNLLTMWAEHAAANGVDPDGLVIEVTGGQRWRIFKTENGFNLEAT
jgi:hypothetical protein